MFAVAFITPHGMRFGWLKIRMFFFSFFGEGGAPIRFYFMMSNLNAIRETNSILRTSIPFSLFLRKACCVFDRKEKVENPKIYFNYEFNV